MSARTAIASPFRVALLVFVAISAATPLALRATDGNQDLTFSNDGILVLTAGDGVRLFGAANDDDRAYAFGHYILDGTDDTSIYFRGVTKTGALTSVSCAVPSEQLFTLSVQSGASAGVVDSTGGLLLAGRAAFVGSPVTSTPLLARFDVSSSGCHLDDSFSSNGWAIYDDGPCAGLSCEITDLVQIVPHTGAVSAPRFVALVRRLFDESPFSYDQFLLGITASGARDSSFGDQGWVDLIPSSLYESFYASLSIDGAGRLYVLVSEEALGGPAVVYNMLYRYSAEGELDLSFGSFGSAHLLPGDDYLGGSFGADVAYAPDGVALSGYVHDSGTWALDGFRSESSPEGFRTSVLTSIFLAPQGNHRFVTAGDIGALDGFQLARRTTDLANDMPADATFGFGGASVHDVDFDVDSAAVERVMHLGLWNGRPLVAGFLFNDDAVAGFLLRAESSYVFADGFEQGTPAYWSAAPGIVFP